MNRTQVVLVNELDQEVGTALKTEVHNDKTPLHRAFSVFLFDQEGRILVQQRALDKITWPGVWSNSCCGHPAPGEGYEEAVRRRVKEELGVEIMELKKAGDYRYRFERYGMVENEVCPVFRGVVAGEVRPDPAEVNDWQWMEWADWLAELESDKAGAMGKWSEWSKEEVRLITA
jgi:isopentenyl-diphosphate delta-isomerase type 1